MRTTKSTSRGVTVSAMSVKSQRSMNITMTMPTSVSVSVVMFSVFVDAKLWIVWTSPVSVDRMVPTRCVS